MNKHILQILLLAHEASCQYSCGAVRESYKTSECCDDHNGTVALPEYYFGSALAKTYDAPSMPTVTEVMDAVTKSKYDLMVFEYKTLMRRLPTQQEIDRYFPASDGVRTAVTSDAIMENDLLTSTEWLNKRGVPDLTGKVAVIAGGSSGVVFSISVLLAQAGCTVYSFARTAAHYDIERTTAMSDGVEMFAQQSAIGEGPHPETPWFASLQDFQKNLVNKDTYHVKESRFNALYSGPLSVPPEVFDRIHFHEYDIRKESDMMALMTEVKAHHAKVDYIVWGASGAGTGSAYRTKVQRRKEYERLQAAGVNLPGVNDEIHPYLTSLEDIPMSKVIELTPNRSIAHGKHSGYWERWSALTHGAHTMMDALFEVFGYENAKENTTISEIGSIAGFAHGVTSFFGPQATDYSIAKASKALAARQYHLDGIKASVGLSAGMRGMGAWSFIQNADFWSLLGVAVSPMRQYQKGEASVLGENGGQHFPFTLADVEALFRFQGETTGAPFTSSHYMAYTYIHYLLKAERTGEFVLELPMMFTEPSSSFYSRPETPIPQELVGKPPAFWQPQTLPAHADSSTWWTNEQALQELNLGFAYASQMHDLRIDTNM